MERLQSRTIVFITGAFLSSSSWDDWKLYYETRGYTCIVPAWPHKDAPADELRERQPDNEIASIRLTTLVDHFTRIIRDLPEKPVLIGHSIGGLVTQLLLQHDLAAAGVAIHPLPPRGINILNFSALRAGWRVLGYFTSTKKSYLMPLSTWKKEFTNGMPHEVQNEAYDRYVVPESKLVNRDWRTKAAEIDFSRPHPPLLIVSGSDDHLVPASFNFKNFKKYSDRESITEYKLFEGRNHFVIGQSTWREDADYILNWIESLRNRPIVPREPVTRLAD